MPSEDDRAAELGIDGEAVASLLEVSGHELRRHVVDAALWVDRRARFAQRVVVHVGRVDPDALRRTPRGPSASAKSIAIV